MSQPERGAATRALAARAVTAVLRQGATLDEALRHPDIANVGALSGPDRAQVRLLAFGAVRGHQRHRALLRQLLHRPLGREQDEVEALLSVGLYQLLDDAQPDYAAVSATVAAARWLGRPRAAGLVNATLRRAQRERAGLLESVLATDEGRFCAPAWLIERLRRDWPGQWPEVLDAALRQPPLWLRVNRLKRDEASYLRRLAEAGHDAGRCADLPGALRLARAVPVAEIPGFADGEATVQDAASQVAGCLLSVVPGMRVLDACAAPGGKATHLLELAGGQLDLQALDIEPARLARVGENLTRLGLQATLLAGDARRPQEWWDRRPYDRILVDAPCSGTGVMRRHPDIKLLRRESDIPAFAVRQAAILAALWPLLRPGGQLLYATCSILRAENGAVITGFLAAHPDAVLLETPPAPLPGWMRPQREGGWQSLPGATDTDGLYYALMAQREAG